MNEEIKYWHWKSTTIDFSKLPNKEECFKNRYMFDSFTTMSEVIFKYLPLPFNETEIHTWYPRKYSSEYNTCLKFTIEIGLAEWIEEE